jgi:hypothetical protein
VTDVDVRPAEGGVWAGLTPPYRTIVADPPWLYQKRPVELPSPDYTGPDPSVECAYAGCVRRLRRSDLGGPQWCSKECRSLSVGGEDADRG